MYIPKNKPILTSLQFLSCIQLRMNTFGYLYHASVNPSSLYSYSMFECDYEVKLTGLIDLMNGEYQLIAQQWIFIKFGMSNLNKAIFQNVCY